MKAANSTTTGITTPTAGEEETASSPCGMGWGSGWRRPKGQRRRLQGQARGAPQPLPPYVVGGDGREEER